MPDVVVVDAPRAAAPVGLPLVKRRSESDKDREPTTALLCDNGLAICRSLGIKSAHLKRTSNSPHVAVTVVHPVTNKRQSVALWKIVTARVEAGWSCEFLNGNVTDLRLENLKTVSPTERDEQAEADALHITEFNLKLAALPPSKEKQDKIARQRQLFEGLSAEEQKEFHKYLCGAARKHISNFNLVEDVVSEIFADQVWPQIVAGKCDAETFEGLRAYAAAIVAFHADIYSKLSAGGHWGDFVPDRPRKLAQHGVKLLEYSPEFTDAAHAEENNLLAARPTHVGDADDQWSKTFGKQVGAMQATRRGLSYRTGADKEEPLHVDDLDVRDVGVERI
jgi:hypothetical protein